MKYSIAILGLLILASLPSQAQVDTTEGNTVVVDNKRVKIIVTEKPSDEDSTITEESVKIIKKKTGDTMVFSDESHTNGGDYREWSEGPEEDENKFIETSWMDFQLGLNNFMNTDSKLEMPEGYEDMSISTGNSINFHWHIVRQAVNLYKEKARFVYGVGIDYNNYRFENNILLSKGPDSLNNALMTTESNIDYKKNKLVTQYLTVPMMLSFDFGNGDDDGFKLSLGANFGYLIGSHQKLKWRDNGKQTSKMRNDFNLEKYRLGYEVQFGYKSLTLYAKYFPQSVFKQDLGPDVRTLSAGIVLGSF